MPNQKYPKSYTEPDLGEPRDVFHPEFKFDSRGRIILPLPGFSKMMLSVEPGSRNISQGTESEQGTPQTDPGSLQSGYIYATTAIKVGPKGGWVTQLAGGTFQYPISYFNETTNEVNFYVDQSGNVYLKGTIIATIGEIGGWTISASELYAGSGASRVGLRPGSWPFYAGSETPSAAPARINYAGQAWFTSVQVLSGPDVGALAHLNAVDTAQIVNLAVTELKIAADAVTAAKIAVGAVTNAKVAADAITQEKIANAAITASKIADAYKILEIVSSLPSAGTAGRIVYLTTDGKIYRDNGTVWKELILPANVYLHLGGEGVSTIGTNQVNNAAITEAKLATGAVTNAKLAADAVTADKIANAAITASKIAAAYKILEIVDTLPAAGTAGRIVYLTTDSKIYRDNGTVWKQLVLPSEVTSHIGGEGVGTIGETKIADGSISTPKLQANSVTTEKLVAGSVTSDIIAANAIIAGKIAAGAVSTNELAAGAVIAVKISASAITTEKLDALAVTSDKIAANAVIAGKIAAGAVNTDQLVAGAVTSAIIAAGAVVADKISAGAVSTDKLAAYSVTAVKIDTGAITSDKIAAYAVTSDKVTTGLLITLSAQIQDGIITNAKISSLDAGKITTGELIGIVIRTASSGQRTNLLSTLIQFDSPSYSGIAQIFASDAGLLLRGAMSGSYVYLQGYSGVSIYTYPWSPSELVAVFYPTYLHMNYHQIKYLAEPSISSDAATKYYVDQQAGGTLSGLTIDITKNWQGYGINNLGPIYVQGVYPYSDLGYSLGSGSYRWYNIQFGGTMYGGNIQCGTIITVGTIRASVSDGYDLGSSSYYWSNVYLDYLRFNIYYGQLYWGGNRAIDMHYTGDTLPSGTSGWHRWDLRVDMIPCADNSGQIGYDSRRWYRVRAVNIQSGDYLFENKFRITELGRNALAFYSPGGELIMTLTKDGELRVKKIIETNFKRSTRSKNQ